LLPVTTQALRINQLVWSEEEEHNICRELNEVLRRQVGGGASGPVSERRREGRERCGVEGRVGFHRGDVQQGGSCRMNLHLCSIFTVVAE
jgi:hypothetical protein